MLIGSPIASLLNPLVEEVDLSMGKCTTAVLLDGQLSSCLLNVYIYTHKLGPPSTLITETFFCNRHYLMLRRITDQSAENSEC